MQAHERLRIAREHAQYRTASDAARALGISVQTYIHHENGTRKLTPHAVRYATFFRVSLSWLLSGKGAMQGGSPIEALYESLPEAAKREALTYLEYLASKHSH